MNINERDKILLRYEKKEILKLMSKIEDIKQEMFHIFAPHLQKEYKKVSEYSENSSIPLAERRKLLSTFRRRINSLYIRVEKSPNYKPSNKRKEHAYFLQSCGIGNSFTNTIRGKY